MTCRNCGTENPPGATVCRVCGRPPGDDPSLVKPPLERAPAPTVLPTVPPRPPRTGPETSKLAIASLVGGVLCWTIAPLLGIVLALVCGHLALREIDRAPSELTGRGLAVAGLALGYVQVAVAALIVVGFCVFTAVSFVLFQSALTAG
jgi:hypothetical protein